MVDPRIATVVGEDHYPCGGTCPLSRNQHVHFPEQFASFLEALSEAIAEPLEAAPDAPDPYEQLRARWKAAFDVVRPELAGSDDASPEALNKAAEIALAMALSVGR